MNGRKQKRKNALFLKMALQLFHFQEQFMIEIFWIKLPQVFIPLGNLKIKILFRN